MLAGTPPVWTRAVLAVAILGWACGSHTPRLNVGPVPAGVTVDARIQYYDVTASNLAELRREMMRLGPRWEGGAFQAVTQSQYSWSYQYEITAMSCRLRRVRVQVETVVIFPRWNPSAEPDSAMVEWWRQLSAGLMEHERGHAKLSVEMAGEIAGALEQLSHARCDATGQQAALVGQRHIALERRRQIEYDRSTRHGATQIEQAGRLRAP